MPYSESTIKRLEQLNETKLEQQKKIMAIGFVLCLDTEDIHVSQQINLYQAEDDLRMELGETIVEISEIKDSHRNF